ncbi:MAG TPA: serine/threonine-protein kinase, partial [Candidatus Eremiobacteraeota bacterium]|nr:serine/threonine-protein kinase [Candidatus Eremiobacteraeota bacterium]
GGMSAIYLGEDINSPDSVCVVKEMCDYFLSPDEKSEAIYMFEVEAFMLLSLRHPGIPSIRDYFIEEDNCYLVMEYIEGVNLGDLLHEHPEKKLPEKDVLTWGIQMCDILEYLHSCVPPIIHRDIKPYNFIKRNSDDKIIIIDFGIASLFDSGQTNNLVGTPGYVAPEQFECRIHTRSDIFSLGATLHHLLTGRDPSEGIPFEFKPVRAIRPDLSEDIEKIIQRALEKDMNKRFNCAKEMKEALRKVVRRKT